MTPSTSVRITTNQNVLLTPNTLSKTKSDSESGTVVLLAVPARYSVLMPSRIRLVASVTISGLRSNTATRTPLTNPMTIATTNTDDDRLGEAVVGALRHPDEDVGEQRDGGAHRQVDAAHHDHQHLSEGDDGDDAAEREQRAPRRRRERARGDDLADRPAAPPSAIQIVTKRVPNSRLLRSVWRLGPRRTTRRERSRVALPSSRLTLSPSVATLVIVAGEAVTSRLRSHDDR